LELRLSRDEIRTGGYDRTRQRAVAGGRIVRLRRGAYVDNGRWQAADGDAQYLARVEAAVETRRSEPVLSHESAALLWGLPALHGWPEDVHGLAGARTSARSKNGFVWHNTPLDDADVVRLGPFLATSLSRTLSDLARSRPMAEAVTFLDHGTRTAVRRLDGSSSRGEPKEQLLDRLGSMRSAAGVGRATLHVRFSDPLSGSPGESYSRVQIYLLGYPRPLLQVPVPRGEGGYDFPDFTWDEAFGEFDGRGKYVREEYTHGRSIQEVVYQEKRREDRLRSTGKGMARWGWAELADQALLDAILRQAGLRPAARRASSWW